MTTNATSLDLERVAAYGATVASQARNGRLDITWANNELTNIATEDLTQACLAFRQSTNAVRLADHAALPDVLDAMAHGDLAATTFNANTTTATLTGNTITVTGTGLMCTGIGIAAWVLVEATHTNDDHAGTTSVIALPDTAITSITRPPFRGLTAADNAVISISATVDRTHIIGTPGGAPATIAAPYQAGLSLAAAATGAAHTITAAITNHGITNLDRTRREQLGEHLAATAAAQALIEALPGHAPDAGWHSKAAKVTATRGAHAYCQWARTAIGSRTYTTTHPLTVLEADLEGLLHQAPTNHGAAAALTDHLT